MLVLGAPHGWAARHAVRAVRPWRARPLRASLRCLYGRLPCDKRILEVLTWRIDCALISGLWLQFGQCPLLALMVIREAGAHLGCGLCTRLVLASQQLYRPTVRPLCHHLLNLTRTQTGHVLFVAANDEFTGLFDGSFSLPLLARRAAWVPPIATARRSRAHAPPAPRRCAPACALWRPLPH